MITVNLELSKKLKEAGYPQEGHFYIIADGYDYLYENKKGHVFTNFEKEKGIVFSPTCDEILEQLLSFIDYDGKIFTTTITHEVSGWNVAYVTRDDKHLLQEFMMDSLADAAAKMWLYLKENNLLEVKG